MTSKQKYINQLRSDKLVGITPAQFLHEDRYVLFMKRQLYILIILIFSISLSAQNDSTQQIAEELIFVVEKMPEFVGGYEALKGYLKTNAVYTEKAINEKVAGRVFISFFVETDGSITDPIVLKGLHPDLDNICLELVKNMPKWTPAEQRGKPIKCRYNLPIEFNFYKNNIEKTADFTISQYWKKKGKIKFIETCSSYFNKSAAECNCWLYYIIWNYNEKKLEELNLDEIFKTQKCK